MLLLISRLRLVYKADAFVDYIFNAHYEDLVLDAQDNVLVRLCVKNLFYRSAVNCFFLTVCRQGLQFSSLASRRRQ